METMLAARLHEIGKSMQLEQVPIPTPRSTDVVVQAGAGALDLSVVEHHTFRLADVNDALDTIPQRHGGFTNFLCVP